MRNGADRFCPHSWELVVQQAQLNREQFTVSHLCFSGGKNYTSMSRSSTLHFRNALIQSHEITKSCNHYNRIIIIIIMMELSMDKNGGFLQKAETKTNLGVHTILFFHT